MKSKTNAALLVLISASLGVGLTTIGITKGHFISQQPKDSVKHDERRGSIKWFVKRAKEQKKTKVFVPPPEESYAEVKSLEDATAQYSALIVEPVEQRTVIWDEAQIVTWHKLKVIEFVSYPSQGCAQCIGSLTAPVEMLPLKVGEVLVPSYGGSLVIDGVQLESRESDFGVHPLLHQRYLVFLSLDPAKSIGKLALGPHGIFVVNPQDQIRPILNSKSMLGRDLDLKLGNSLTKLKDHLRGSRSN